MMDTFELDIAGGDFTDTQIYTAIKEHRPEDVLRAIYAGENVHARDPDFNTTYLHLLVNEAESLTEEKLVSIVYQLSNAGVEIDAVDYKGETALEKAIQRELQHVIAALIRAGADLGKKDYKMMIRNLGSPFELAIRDMYDKYEPGLWVAVQEGNTAMVQLLVNSWCRVNTKRGDQSLLGYAQASGQSDDMITILDDIEVTMEFVHATLAGDEARMLEFLMDSKPCDPYIMDINHQERWSAPIAPRSLRDTAVAMGHSHVLHLLPEDDMDKDDDIKGYYGGVTLATTTRKQPKSSNKTPNGTHHRRDSDSALKTIGNVPPTQRHSKLKPLKATVPMPQLKSNGKSQTPDVIAHNSDSALSKLKLDLLNNFHPMEDEELYEQSRFTGSVALRSKAKSRPSILGARASMDDWTMSNGRSNQHSDISVSDMHTIEHIATPRGRHSPNLWRSNSKEHSKNWLRASLKSRSKSKSRENKDPTSKLCVIS